MNKAVITKLNSQPFLLIYEEDVLVECHPLMNDKPLQIGDIYIGRVEKVVKNIQSAFIRLDKENAGYLPLNDKPALVLNRRLPKGLPSIAENDIILVQVEQEPQKMKQARVTGNICLSGNYVAMDLSKGTVGVSKRIKDKQRITELKQLVKEYTQPDTSYGIVFRTASEYADSALILAEINRFAQELDRIIHKAQYERNTGIIHKGKEDWIALLEEYGITRIDEAKTDLPEVYKELTGVVSNTVFYEDDYPLYKLLGLETELSRILNKKVWLKSGGFLIIEPTEAMVVIDVNSGKSIGSKNKDAHILKLNMEAALEITRQLRLRNLSGIIMVDFINMEREDDKTQVIHCLEQGLKRDKVPGYFVEVTKLDLYELTRKKVRKPIHELLHLDFLSQIQHFYNKTIDKQDFIC